MMIDFNRPPYVGKELEYIKEAVRENKICGDGAFTKKCSAWMEQELHTKYSPVSYTHLVMQRIIALQKKVSVEALRAEVRYTAVKISEAITPPVKLNFLNLST